MTKIEFMSELKIGLKRLEVAEREDILRDYDEHFMMGMQEGKTEEEICKSLGEPKQMSKELMAEYHIEQIEKQFSFKNIWGALLSVTALGFFNLVFILGPVIAVFGIVFALWVCIFAFSILLPIYPIVCILGLSTFIFFEFFTLLILCALGLLLGILMKRLTKWILRLFIRYLKYNVSIVKRGWENE
ncbi:hypothetical protein FACS189418_2130 [Clostridia bacterium]|nr:hypothetical protein FACS189418_2130 [Clostridia bacterium]